MFNAPLIRAAITAFALVLSLPAWSISPLVVDDASIHGTDEQEWVPAFDNLRIGTVETGLATVSLATGLNSRVEGTVRAGYGWFRDRTAGAARSGEGPADVNLGLKSTLWSADRLPFRFSTSGTLKLPTATVRSGLGTGQTDFTGLAIGTLALGPVLVDFNAGYTWTAVSERSRRTGDGWFAGSAVRWRVSAPLLLFAETYATRPAAAGAGSDVNVRLGAQYEFRKGRHSTWPSVTDITRGCRRRCGCWG